jgi:hypothetical protein
MSRFDLVFLFTLCAATVAQAQDTTTTQPLSHKLAECGIVFKTNAVLAVQKGRDADETAKYRQAGDLFQKTAIEQAQKEGQADSVAYIEEIHQSLLPKWHKKYNAMMEPPTLADAAQASADMMKWAEFCGGLGKKTGLLPLPETPAP